MCRLHWVGNHLNVSLQIDHEFHTNANSNTFRRGILGNGLRKCNLCARNVYSLQYHFQCPQAPQRLKDSFTWLTSAFPQCTEPYSAKHEATAFLFMLFHVSRGASWRELQGPRQHMDINAHKPFTSDYHELLAADQ